MLTTGDWLSLEHCSPKPPLGNDPLCDLVLSWIRRLNDSDITHGPISRADGLSLDIRVLRLAE
jgi:hypothetical protein